MIVTILELHKKGMSENEIASLLHVTVGEIRRNLIDYGIVFIEHVIDRRGGYGDAPLKGQVSIEDYISQEKNKALGSGPKPAVSRLDQNDALPDLQEAGGSPSPSESPAEGDGDEDG